MRDFLYHLATTAAGLAPLLLVAAWIYPHQSVVNGYVVLSITAALVTWSEDRRRY